jgi:peptidoglycan hydrolase-like protein with peptidoglycan-binding domain
MRVLRPALLVLLTSALAGLGVPASFGQAEAASGKAAKKKPTASGPASKSGHPAKSPTKSTGKAAASKTSAKHAGRGSAKSRKQTGQKAPTSDRISEIQAALAKDGSYQGTPSGKWDDDTAAAMRKFQSAHGLTASGKLDAPSLQRLGLGSQTAGMAPPTPPPGATSRLTSLNSAPSGNDPSRPQ